MDWTDQERTHWQRVRPLSCDFSINEQVKGPVSGLAKRERQRKEGTIPDRCHSDTIRTVAHGRPESFFEPARLPSEETNRSDRPT